MKLDRATQHDLRVSSNNERIHVFLLEPLGSLNVGSVARAMSNLGFSHLHLIAPRNYHFEKAAKTACWATDVLEKIQVHDTLGEALSEMNDVVGFTSNYGRDRIEHILLDDWIPQLNGEFQPSKIGLLFGPEDNGLQRDHIKYCRSLIRIPTVSDNPSLNLSQAVLLVLYELSKQKNALNEDASEIQYASWSAFNKLDEYIESLGTASGFFGEATSNAIPRLLQGMFRRIKPTEREMNILLGLFRHIADKIKP
ncbi:MAG: hypothetical protein KDD53_04640 [Bdellovibrionales bacterium]|nr:hypothetical protein [Bdellovibrionales bacterium]